MNEINYGQEEGDTCNRWCHEDTLAIRCTGIMIFRPVENCSCYINPPCAACEDNAPQCNECGAPSEL